MESLKKQGISIENKYIGHSGLVADTLPYYLGVVNYIFGYEIMDIIDFLQSTAEFMIDGYPISHEDRLAVQKFRRFYVENRQPAKSIQNRQEWELSVFHRYWEVDDVSGDSHKTWDIDNYSKEEKERRLARNHEHENAFNNLVPDFLKKHLSRYIYFNFIKRHKESSDYIRAINTFIYYTNLIIYYNGFGFPYYVFDKKNDYYHYMDFLDLHFSEFSNKLTQKNLMNLLNFRQKLFNQDRDFPKNLSDLQVNWIYDALNQIIGSDESDYLNLQYQKLYKAQFN